MKWPHKTPNDVKNFNGSKRVSVFGCCTDASFAVHPNFRTHTGGLDRFGGGRGFSINMSTKQKLNADLAEPEAVGKSLP